MSPIYSLLRNVLTLISGAERARLSFCLSCSRLTPLTTSPGRAWEGELEEEDAARRDQQLGGQGERHGIPCLVSMSGVGDHAGQATMVDFYRGNYVVDR